jgi:3-oxoacyl-[acyl-carrier protein] reductase
LTEQNEQRVAIVTGASRGIGRGIARRLAADGRRVILMSRSQGPLEELASEIESGGGSAAARAVDVGDAAALAEAVEGVARDEGRLDILVNNAGITRDNLALRMSDEEFDEVVRVNLKSAFVACRAAARPMMKGRFGRLVNIGSTSGVIGNAGQANYCAAKAGLVGLTKSFARELGSKGVTANIVAPGFIQTDMTANLPEDATRKFMDQLSIRRLGEVEDIAAAVSYVSSDDAGYLTGQTICVDGGLTMC